MSAFNALNLNKLPKEIRDECRQNSTIPKNVLIQSARKKQERSMLTRFRQYRDPQAKAAASDDGAQTERKRTRAEALVNSIGTMMNKIGDLDFPSFSVEDRAMVIEFMTSMKDTLEAKPSPGRCEKK